MSIYHMINVFFLFSFMGYVLECIVLTIQYKKLVINWGFGHGPFCIIYGFGALGAYLVLSPFEGHFVQLYFASMLMATLMELVTAAVMIRLFGSLWWDYSDKKFNYKGIICAESSIAWGFLGIFFFTWLNGFAHSVVAKIPENKQKYLAILLLTFYIVDFLYCMWKRLNGQDMEDMDGIMKVN